MTDEKMIIKALECCEKNEGECPKSCPLFKETECLNKLANGAFALIKQLKEENAELREDLESYYRNCPTF